ncbi:hypothetical protein N7492_006819 [Penicillium capsulatum]|uniref:Uncharacterized protein n=1 Tax=Penicillium capsulatum TaxID=69766 RepID=A0A9W9I1H1_9EURO|nr:hypothetical protein N7492_006819 [Penicillium capsulatum]KAJ6116654.1 hypothetical protein N7512_006379 [Penicillium capsulatum]
MRSPPQPATVHELNEDGSPMLHTKVSATRNRVTRRNATPYSLNRAQQRPRRALDCIVGKSIRSGSLHEMVKNPGQNSAVPMIIFSRHQDTDSERNKIPGCRFRKVSFLDETEVLNSSAVADDSQRCMGLTAFITKIDEDHPYPKIYVEQRVYEGMHDTIIVHELAFGGRIQIDKEYLFPGCGDEDPILGKRDLKLRIVSLEQESWANYLRGHTTLYGYDIKDYVYLDEGSIYKDLPHTVWRNPSKASYKISLNAKDMQILLKAKQGSRDTASVLSSEGIELLRLRFPGQGHPTEDNLSTGDLIVHIIYRS